MSAESSCFTRDEIERIRREFPVVKNYAYFLHAAVAPIPLCARAAMDRIALVQAEHGCVRYPEWLSGIAEARSLAAEMVGTAPQEIAFVKNTSHGLAVAAQAIDWNAGDEIVSAEGEFPANVYPWLALGRRGVSYRTVAKRSDGRYSLEDFKEALSRPNVRALTISAVEYSDGFRHDLEALGTLCADRGLFFIVDGIQAMGVLPVDVKRCRIDFFSADGHKWMLGPEGAGILYVNPERYDEILPSNIGWLNVKDPLDFDAIDFTLRPDAGRFEEGTPSTILIHGLGASLELLSSAGIDRIAARVRRLTERLIAGLDERGWNVVSSRFQAERSGITAFRPSEKKISVEAVRAHLERAGIQISVRAGSLRAAPHFYNTEEEIDRLLEGLDSFSSSP